MNRGFWLFAAVLLLAGQMPLVLAQESFGACPKCGETRHRFPCEHCGGGSSKNRPKNSSGSSDRSPTYKDQEEALERYFAAVKDAYLRSDAKMAENLRAPDLRDPALRERFARREAELCESLGPDYAIRALSMESPKITEALIASKNNQLPEFLATATVEQRKNALTAVEKQIAKGKVRMGELNEQGRAALEQGKKTEGSNFRKQALQVGAYLDVLKEIKAILEGS